MEIVPMDIRDNGLEKVYGKASVGTSEMNKNEADNCIGSGRSLGSAECGDDNHERSSGSGSISSVVAMRHDYSPVVRESDYVVLVFSDGRQLFGQAVRKWKGKSPPVKISKRSYPTKNLIGLPYGTVLEVGPKTLVPLPNGEGLVPSGSGEDVVTTTTTNTTVDDNNSNSNINISFDRTRDTATSFSNDNRDLVDDNSSQSIHQEVLTKMRKEGTHGSVIVKALIENSATFSNKTEFSKAKYIAKKQKKYQLRCRMERPTARSVCELCFHKDSRRIMNLREDTLAQIMSYANVHAGSQVLLFEMCLGIVTGALAQRMGGYGKILSLYTGAQPSFLDIIAKYNLTFAEDKSIKWVHAGEIFGSTDNDTPTSNTSSDTNDNDTPNPNTTTAADTSTDRTADTTNNINNNTNNTNNSSSSSTTNNNNNNTNTTIIDWEARDRDSLDWPCELQSHTTVFLSEEMQTDEERRAFLLRRAARFARKLTRPTPLETASFLHANLSDSLVLATSKYDPTATLLRMLPFLAPSCPFVVLSEHMEPLVECFRTLQTKQLAINLRLTDTWMRQFQVLPSRTHPHMTMSQSGGFLLTGIKICPKHGINELDMDSETEKQIRSEMGGRRGKKQRGKQQNNSTTTNNNNSKDPSSKRRRGKDAKLTSTTSPKKNKDTDDDQSVAHKKIKTEHDRKDDS